MLLEEGSTPYSKEVARVRRNFAGTLAILLCAVISACGGLSTTSSSTPAHLPTVTADQFHAACPSGQGFGAIYQSGDAYIAVSLIGLAYPAAKLPDGVPLRPFKLPSGAGDLHGLPQSPEVNPELEHTGIMVEYCNGAKGASHRVEGASVRIDRFTPYTGTLNSWQFCDGFYTNGQVNGGGCGGHFFADELLHATFTATAGSGATRNADFIKVVSEDTPPSPPLPFSLAPGQSVLLEVTITAPNAPGTYGFSFSVGVDGAHLPYAALAEDLLFDSAARKWSGDACTTSAMQAQIASGSADLYICPTSAT
jgi:hypothetical protein